eukprot:TRINITY_DN3005_c0_g1_i2.p1 TRINITY_DN3005_c0_g1~~TRINITY_DN3005_c0_g1_i2.p1  ORF type:complete len:237 (+),score=52.26 TRINITY_DN3005_c0_g1_i2:107-712(+)
MYESHITVKGTTEIERFKEVCSAIRAKAILIELDEGQTPEQLMSGRWHVGTFENVKNEVHEMALELQKAGFQVIRKKIEANASAKDVPITDAEAIESYPPTNYFEFHIKLFLPLQFDETRLRTIASTFGGHLSRSAFKRVTNGEYRFVTLRHYKVGRDTAFKKLETALDSLRSSGYEIESVQREYSVMDSNISVDAGWIEK